MPRKLDAEEELARLKQMVETDPQAQQHYSVRLPADVAYPLQADARAKGIGLSREIGERFTYLYTCSMQGVACLFADDVADQLERCAYALGTDREDLVKRIVAEHIAEYFSKAIEAKKRRDAMAAGLPAAPPRVAPASPAPPPPKGKRRKGD